MARDVEVATYLRTDSTLTGILLGGIYAESEIGGIGGFVRGSDNPDDSDYSPTAAAFDEDGFLRPSLMVGDRAQVPFGDVLDLAEQKASASQVTELYFYEDRGHEEIDIAKERAYALMQGHRFSGAYPARWALDTPPVPDTGPLAGNTTIRQDWQIVSIRGN